MSAIPMTQLGSRAFNHGPDSSAEQEYDRLRDLARSEQGKMQSCFERSRQAYERGDGGAAHDLSQEGKRHQANRDQYNKQASEFIFRENNSTGRVADDTIDLHGLFVEEAEDILEERIKYAQQHGQTHLHVIVGKGNHSVNHVQKIKPRVEQVCRELGLQYNTEANAGRIYINLTGGPADQIPPSGGYNNGGQQHHGGQQQPHHGGQQQYPGGQPQQQPHYGGGQNNNQNDEVEEVVKKLLPRVIKALRGCCNVM